MEAWAVYGGRFDPFHNAHYALVHQALASLPIAKLLVVPNGAPVHTAVVASWAERMTMAKLALSDCPEVEVVGYESPEQARPAITTASNVAVQTSTQIWVVGADSFASLATWQQWEKLVALVNWAVMPRPSLGSWQDLDPAVHAELTQVTSAEQLATGTGKFWVWEEAVAQIDASSLQVQIATNNDQWQQLVPAKVANYIVENKLYQ